MREVKARELTPGMYVSMYDVSCLVIAITRTSDHRTLNDRILGILGGRVYCTFFHVSSDKNWIETASLDFDDRLVVM